jgi:hypothetical protein
MEDIIFLKSYRLTTPSVMHRQDVEHLDETERVFCKKDVV